MSLTQDADPSAFPHEAERLRNAPGMPGALEDHVSAQAPGQVPDRLCRIGLIHDDLRAPASPVLGSCTPPTNEAHPPCNEAGGL
jgi:hypothetical protein